MRHGAIGIVTEIFDDLNPAEPWVRVLFTHPEQTYQWCKMGGLELIRKDEQTHVPLLANDSSGSL